MRFLIYGAGVIGSLYAAKLAGAGFPVTVYARGERLQALARDGLRYRTKDGVARAEVTVISRLPPGDRYDYVLVAVRAQQLRAALSELRENESPVIVTMVNSTEPYGAWEALCGKGRVLPAFPGAGGGFDGGVLDAGFTPAFLQPTVIAGTDPRAFTLAAAFRRAGVPCRLVRDMHAWQICHLALVVPLADAYYEAEDPSRAGRDAALMRRTAARIRDNLRGVSARGLRMTPARLWALRLLPPSWTAPVLGRIYRSGFGERFMYRHAIKAPDEMAALREALADWLKG